MHRHHPFHREHAHFHASEPCGWGGFPAALFLAGRGGHGHGHGPFGHGFRGFGFGGGGPGGPGDFAFRAGRKLSSADLQLLLLALLDEQPRHGYDLIKAVEERSNGFYVPSPGVVYPALSYLEEAGDAVPEAEGTRKRYRLTDAGRARLAERRADADAILAQLQELGQRMDRLREAFAAGAEDEGHGAFPRGRARPELAAAIRKLWAAIGSKRGASREELLRVAGVLERAAAEVRGPSSEES